MKISRKSRENLVERISTEVFFVHRVNETLFIRAPFTKFVPCFSLRAYNNMLATYGARYG